jgi:alkylation response protein AidB-like acyl-CoA dehydrogenase
MLERVSLHVPDMAARGAVLDAQALFPQEDMAILREAGVLAAPVPEALGGLGAGTEPGGAMLALELLRMLGRGNLALARLFEAHLNALRLVIRFGTAEQIAAAAADALAGHRFGLWVTDDRRSPLRWQQGALMGRKGPSSGAGHCSRALVTVATDDGVRMAMVALTGAEKVVPVAGLQGMRAAANGTVTLDGAEVMFWVGAPGDYLREPDFSCGAWRASAAAAGGLEALVEAAAAGLRRREQTEAPLQLARYGAMLIARDTALMWLERAAVLAEAETADPSEQTAVVNLARTVVERACLDAIRDAQRSLGLGAFVAPNPVERLARDLGTYLRQPSPDEVLLEAAAWFLQRA